MRSTREKLKYYKKITPIIFILVLAVMSLFWLDLDRLDQITKLERQQELQLEKIANLEYQFEILKESQKTEKVEVDKETVLRVAEICTAESSTIEGQQAVAEVIKNRSELWNKSLLEVIEQPKQFAKPKNTVSKETLQAVADVLNGNVRVFESTPTHFITDGSDKPMWVYNKECMGEIGGNVFYG